MTIDAVFEDGVFRPIGKVDLPEHCAVRVEIIAVDSSHKADSEPPMTEGLARIYEILSERYDSGFSDTAARHNEHQP